MQYINVNQVGKDVRFSPAAPSDLTGRRFRAIKSSNSRVNVSSLLFAFHLISGSEPMSVSKPPLAELSRSQRIQ